MTILHRFFIILTIALFLPIDIIITIVTTIHGRIKLMIHLGGGRSVHEFISNNLMKDIEAARKDIEEYKRIED